jgi:hypothetical protein
MTAAGQQIGAIGVSGATSDQDEQWAQAGIDAIAAMLKSKSRSRIPRYDPKNSLAGSPSTRRPPAAAAQLPRAGRSPANATLGRIAQ